MEARFLNAKGVEHKSAALARDYDDIRPAIACATDGPHARVLLAHSAKMTRLVVGSNST